MTYRLTIRARPGASRTHVGGNRAGTLVVAVTAPAQDDRANTAIIKALAKAFGLRPHQVTIATGHHSRDKLVDLAMDPAAAEPIHVALLDA